MQPGEPQPDKPAAQQSAPTTNRVVLVICLALAAGVVGIYARTMDFDFLDYDDHEYIYENPHVTCGLTTDGIAWSFAHAHSANWHPFTWVSHMADWELYGPWAGGHHLTNVIIHAFAVVVLFLALRRLTGDVSPSAFTAAVFAIHPLHVESVAWVSERKDVLSGLFFGLTLWAYAGYARSPTTGGYVWVAGAFAAGLMAKPMLVTLPFVLLLLDYWPLRRFGAASPPGEARRAILEKLPLLAIAAASCAMTVYAQSTAAAFEVGDTFPFQDRVANALVSYVMYLAQTACPFGLAVFYPHPTHTTVGIPIWAAVGSGALLLITSLAVVAQRRRYPYIAVGWFWFLGMLVPVIGLVQVGVQARADRYTYLPQIGLGIALAWFAADTFSVVWCRRGAAVVLLVLAGLAWRQVGYWRDTEALFAHSLDVTQPTWMTHTMYAGALAKKSKFEEAMPHFRAAFEIAPDFRRGRQNLCTALTQWGDALAQQGRMEAAAACLEEALAIDPQSGPARKQLAMVAQIVGLGRARQRRPAEAVAWFRRAVELVPKSPAAHYNLGRALLDAGRPQDAAVCFRMVLELDPANAAARANLDRVTRDSRP